MAHKDWYVVKHNLRQNSLNEISVLIFSEKKKKMIMLSYCLLFGLESCKG